MPTWNQINREIDGLNVSDACDRVRQKYLQVLAGRLGHPVIAYYSGFMQKRRPDGRSHPESGITDLDLNGFMSVVHNLDRTKGVALMLHTPGGGIEATRSIVEYLHKMFNGRLDVIVPQMAMSAGTMIACAAREVAMSKHSCLGPCDPQINGLPALGVLAEVDRAIIEMKQEPLKQVIWQQVFNKYPPAFIMDCERSVDHARAMVKAWLIKGMLSSEAHPEASADAAVAELTNYLGTSGHGHHFLIDKCRGIGLKIREIEADQGYQEDVLSVHHAFMASFPRTDAIKIIQNSEGAMWNIDV